MKKNLIFRLTFIIAIITFLINCKSDLIEDILKPSSNCRIIKAVVESQSSNDSHKEISTTEYVYNTNGDLIKKSLVIDGKTKSYYVQNETYRYNPEGFLIEQTIVGINDEPNINVRKTSSNSKFSYTDSRLTTIEKSNTNLQGNVSLDYIKYLYDANGVLLSKAKTNSVGSIFTSTYNSNGELIDYEIKTSTETTKPYTLQNGLVIKDSSKGYYSSNEYNAQRQIVKSQFYNNNKLNSYFTFEYYNGLHSEATMPNFKGFPIIKNEKGELGVFAKFQYFAEPGNGALEKLNESANVCQKNSNGLVTKIELTNLQFSPVTVTPVTTIKSTQVFTYANCD